MQDASQDNQVKCTKKFNVCKMQVKIIKLNGQRSRDTSQVKVLDIQDTRQDSQVKIVRKRYKTLIVKLQWKSK